jgi:hypothetical protein
MVLAEETGVAIIAVRHLTKKTGSSAMYRGGGSIGLIGAARTALLVGYDPYDPDSRILAVTKNNLGKTPKSWRYQLESKSGCTVENQPWEASIVKWMDLSDVSANQLVAEPKPDKTGAMQDAMTFLLEVLADGPVAKSQISKLAEKKGHSQSTLNKAKKKLGVKSTQNYDEGKIVGWEWGLPDNLTTG